MMVKRYRVRLAEEERRELMVLVSTGRRTRTRTCRSRGWFAPLILANYENNRDRFGNLIYDRVLDSSLGTLPTPPCATSTVPTGRHNSTLKNAAHHHGGCTMRRRYSRFTARLTVAGDTPKDLATRRWLTPLATISMTAASRSSDNRRGAPSFLPSAFAFSKPALVRRRMDTSSWSDTQAAKPARV